MYALVKTGNTPNNFPETGYKPTNYLYSLLLWTGPDVHSPRKTGNPPFLQMVPLLNFIK
ncbi:hypothetical protein [Pontibacter qinzhouensis]|uniref:hypothetical protein n=1 Tax=Pontibacter qinzhouensis TaxID=2603253 RepID=UPI001650599A|nr:hypothetical protein [Pontibacter qinzhouensis]